MLLDYYHHIRAPHVSFKPLPALYISFTLRTLAISLVSVFIPIFILEQTGDFAFVLLFWGLNAILVVLSAIPLGFVVSRLGLKWSVFVSAVLLAVEFYLFSVLGKYPGLLWVIPVFEAGKLLLFWIPYHLIFIENGSDKHSGEQVSIVGVISRLVAVVAPLVGGFLIAQRGFPTVFYLAIFLILVSSLPLFVMPQRPLEEFPGWRHILSNTFKGYQRMFLAFWGVRSVDLVASMVWPVFLFGIAGDSYEQVGLITSAVLLVSVATILAVGRATDRVGKERILRVGAWVNSVVWVIKSFVRTPVEAFLVDSANKFVDGLQGVPFEALTYIKARTRRHRLEFVVRREILLHFGGLITVLLMAALWILGTPLPALFVIASIGYFVSTLLISSK